MGLQEQRVSVHPIALYSIILVTFGKKYKSRFFSLPNFLQRHVTSSPFGPYTPCSTQFSGSLHSSLNMTDQTSDPQKTNPKITVLYTYLYIFNSGQQHWIFWPEWQSSGSPEQLGPTQPSVRRVPGLFPVGKAAKAWHLTPTSSSDDVKTDWSSSLLPFCAFMGCYRENLTF